MGDMGEIGWYVKLETLNQAKHSKKNKEKDKIKQPLFQFRFEERSGKFIREIKEKSSVDNAAKNPMFSNGEWRHSLFME